MNIGVASRDTACFKALLHSTPQGRPECLRRVHVSLFLRTRATSNLYVSIRSSARRETPLGKAVLMLPARVFSRGFEGVNGGEKVLAVLELARTHAHYWLW